MLIVEGGRILLSFTVSITTSTYTMAVRSFSPLLNSGQNVQECDATKV